MMTYGEIYKKFCEITQCQVEDYRPISFQPGDLIGKTGIRVWLKNGDSIMYFPKELNGGETMNLININDYIYFNCDDGKFTLTNEAKEILYRKKQIICSYSGCIEWGHEFFCELLDLYSGCSIYNYSLNSFKHKETIEELYRKGHSAEVSQWLEKIKDKTWFTKCADMLVTIIDDIPEKVI